MQAAAIRQQPPREEEEEDNKESNTKSEKNFIMGHMLGHGDYPVIKMTNMMSQQFVQNATKRNNVGDDSRCEKMMLLRSKQHPSLLE